MDVFGAMMCELEISRTYGDLVSIENKAKSLRKFGRTDNADDGVKTTVATFQGGVVNETFATTNSVDYVVSDSASDTGIVTIEGHYFDENNNFVFSVENVTLTGVTPVPLSRGYCRVNRIFLTDGTFSSPPADLVGDVYAYDSTLAGGVTSGVPDDPTATKCMLVAGQNQSAKCATALSNGDYWVGLVMACSVSRDSGNSVVAEFDIEYRVLGGVWRPVGLEVVLFKTATSYVNDQIFPYAIIPKNSDVRLVATSNTNNTSLSGHISGYLAQVRG